MSGAAVLQGLLDNKREYTEHLCDVLGESLLQEFADAYDRIRQNPARRGNILSQFQSALAEIPEWNAARVRALYQSVRERSGCGYVGDLVKGILITAVKVQVVSHGSPSEASRRIKLRVPSAENFTHACAIAAARSFWKRPYLFYHEVRSLERQHNLVQAEGLVKAAVKNTLRSYVPMDQLMQFVPLAGADVPPDPIVRGEGDDSETDGDDEADEADGTDEADDTADDDASATDEDSYVDVAKADGGADDGAEAEAADGSDDGASDEDDSYDRNPIAEPEDDGASDVASDGDGDDGASDGDGASDETDGADGDGAAGEPARARFAQHLAARLRLGETEDDDSLNSTRTPEAFAAFGEADASGASDGESDAPREDAAMNLSDLERIVGDGGATDSDDDGDARGGDGARDGVRAISIGDRAREASESDSAGDDGGAPAPRGDVRVIPLPGALVNRARFQKPRGLLRPPPAAGIARRAEGAFF